MDFTFIALELLHLIDHKRQLTLDEPTTSMKKLLSQLGSERFLNFSVCTQIAVERNCELKRFNDCQLTCSTFIDGIALRTEPLEPLASE